MAKVWQNGDRITAQDTNRLEELETLSVSAKTTSDTFSIEEGGIYVGGSALTPRQILQLGGVSGETTENQMSWTNLTGDTPAIGTTSGSVNFVRVGNIVLCTAYGSVSEGHGMTGQVALNIFPERLLPDSNFVLEAYSASHQGKASVNSICGITYKRAGGGDFAETPYVFLYKNYLLGESAGEAALQWSEITNLNITGINFMYFIGGTQ